MGKTLIAVSLGLVGLVAVTGSHARPLKPEEEARIQPVGKPVNCVRIAEIDESRVRSNDVIDFYMKGGKVYRVRLPNGCPQLGFEERFSYKASTQELCSSDIITVLTGPGIGPGPSCGMGDFQEVTGAPRGH